MATIIYGLGAEEGLQIVKFQLSDIAFAPT